MVNKILITFRKIPKHTYLLFGIILFVFVFPVIKSFGSGIGLVSVSYTIMLLSVGAILETKNKKMNILVLLAVLFQWIVFFVADNELDLLSYFSFLFSVAVFIMATYLMIHQIIRAKEVDLTLIMVTIIGYLLIGIIFTMVNSLVLMASPDAISFNTDHPNLSDIIYYSFITVTTVGYGDISPVSPIARELAVLFSLLGQFYLTIVIAFIIGKFLSKQK